VNVTRNANTTTQLRGVEVASFNGTAGSDTFAFYGQTGGTLLIAYGQGGDDHAVFGATSRYDVDGIGAGVVNVTRNASATTQLNGVKTVSLFGTAGNDTFAFYRPPTGFATDFHVYGMENTPLPSGGDLLYFAPGNGWASPNAGVVMNSNGRKVTYNGIEKF
jgi:hypothetical protein